MGIGRVWAAEFHHSEEDFYAFYFQEDENFGDYFDENGGTLRKAFLRAPLNFSRISSRYSKRRIHPVTGRVKPHLGTDYAAPKGPPFYLPLTEQLPKHATKGIMVITLRFVTTVLILLSTCT